MGNKIAIAVVHGIGTQTENFIDRFQDAFFNALDSRCHEDVVLKGVLWAPELQHLQKALWERVESGGPLSFPIIRSLMVDLIADALAYQPVGHRHNAYERIHARFAKILNDLAKEAGENAPLCIVAHSLGTVISSNYLYDLQVDPERSIISDTVRQEMSNTSLERGETLALLYTLGSPIALWSLRYEDFGKPIQFPTIAFKQHYPDLHHEWVNFYDKHDVIGFPLKSLNDDYGKMVTADHQVNVGNIIQSWNPLSHLVYWQDPDVISEIAESVKTLWEQLNPGA